VRSRNLARVTAVAIGIAVPLVVGVGTAAASIKPDDGEVPGPSLGLGLTLLYFVVIPIGAFLVIGGLALLPSALHKPRYRPGKPWDHDPLWFRGPDDPEEALEGARPGSTVRGGARAEW
jgi:hypothetical protein